MTFWFFNITLIIIKLQKILCNWKIHGTWCLLATFQFKIGISITQKCERIRLIIDPKGHRSQLPKRERYPGKIRFWGSPRRVRECTGKRQMLAFESDEATTCKWLAYLRFTFPRLAETRRVVNVFKNLQLLHDRKQVSPSL